MTGWPGDAENGCNLWIAAIPEFKRHRTSRGYRRRIAAICSGARSHFLSDCNSFGSSGDSHIPDRGGMRHDRHDFDRPCGTGGTTKKPKWFSILLAVEAG